MGAMQCITRFRFSCTRNLQNHIVLNIQVLLYNTLFFLKLKSKLVFFFSQAYCNIVTGACFALGLKFAGSADQDAFETLLFFCHMFTSLTGKSIAELAGKATIETCLNVLLLSASMVSNNQLLVIYLTVESTTELIILFNS